MSENPQRSLTTQQLWIIVGIYTVVVLGIGLWVALQIGSPYPALIAVALTLPVELILLRRGRR